jgi:hypothetical protein
MHAIKDSVHDHIEVDALAEALLDTPAVQRLRHVKQLSTVRLVYPSASHTRFEHSLGVYHLASRALASLPVSESEARHVRAAALVHDVGHGPYGHQTEGVLRRHAGRHHDEVADLLSGTEVGDVLTSHGVDPERVAALVRGEGRLGPLVSSALDVDRTDYLVRDAHHTGVPYGTVDHERLVRAFRLVDDELVLGPGNLRTAESVLVARALMNATVYRHHVSRIAGGMLELAAERLLAGEGEGDDGGEGASGRRSSAPADPPSVGAFARMADHDLLVALCERVPALGRRLERRDLYKRAVWAGVGDVPEGFVGLPYEDERALARGVADRAGVPSRAVVVDAPAPPSFRESDARVVVDGRVRRLGDVSELVDALRRAERGGWRFGVYAPAEHRAAVAEAAVAALGLPDRATYESG